MGGHEGPGGEGGQEVAVEAEDGERGEGLKGSLGDADDVVVAEVELPEGDEVVELVPLDLLQLVVLQVQRLEAGEPVEGLAGERGHAAGVHEERAHPPPPDEALRVDVAEVVAVHADDGGVHGDEEGHVGVVAGGALDDVDGPGRVMEAGAALGALHAAVAGVEVAAHAEGEAVGLVLAQELFAGHLVDGDYRPVFTEAASDLVEVLDAGAVGAEVVVDGLQPLGLAVAGEGVAAQEERGAIWKSDGYFTVDVRNIGSVEKMTVWGPQLP